MLEARLEFSDLNLSFISHFPKATIGLENISLVGVGDFSKDTLVSAKEIDIAVDILSLIGNDGIKIHHIILDRPAIRAVKLSDGRVNWDIMESDSTTQTTDTITSEPSNFALQLQKFSINSGRPVS